MKSWRWKRHYMYTNNKFEFRWHFHSTNNNQLIPHYIVLGCHRGLKRHQIYIMDYGGRRWWLKNANTDTLSIIKMKPRVNMKNFVDEQSNIDMCTSSTYRSWWMLVRSRKMSWYLYIILQFFLDYIKQAFWIFKISWLRQRSYWGGTSTDNQLYGNSSKQSAFHIFLLCGITHHHLVNDLCLATIEHTTLSSITK